MRRKEKERTENEVIESIISKAEICRIAMCDADGHPYMVPMNFGFENGVLYFHSACQGRKIEILRKNPEVFIEFEGTHKIVEASKAQHWTADFESVMGKGTVIFIEAMDEKIFAFNAIMNKYSGTKEWSYPEELVRRTCIFKIQAEDLTAKVSDHTTKLSS